MKVFWSLDRRGGFTLVELLAALAVFAVLSAMAYGGLGSLLQVKAQGERHMERLAALQLFFSRFGRDVEQALPRGVMDGNHVVHPALVGMDGAGPFLELTHGGRLNPRGLPRSALERVAYSLESGGEIVRRAWPALDRVMEEEPEGSVLLTDVGEVEIRFLAPDSSWQGVWPVAVKSDAEASMTTLPIAVEIVIEVGDWGRIRRVFELPTEG